MQNEFCVDFPHISLCALVHNGGTEERWSRTNCKKIETVCWLTFSRKIFTETGSCGQELLNRSTAHLEQSLTQHTGFHTVLPHVAPVYYGPIPTYVQPSQQYYHPSTSSATYTQAVNPSTSTAYTGPTTRYRSAMQELQRLILFEFKLIVVYNWFISHTNFHSSTETLIASTQSIKVAFNWMPF